MSSYTVLILVGGIISSILAVLAWRRRPEIGATTFSLMMLAVAEWSLTNVLEMTVATLSAKVFWAKVEYIGIVAVPMTWLCFALQYTSREKWVTRRNLCWLALIPLITLLLVWSNDIHGLIWSEIAMDTSGPTPLLALTHGVWFWVYIAFSYIVLLTGTLLFAHSLIYFPRHYRGQTIALLIGIFAPWVGNYLYLSGLSPFPHTDLTLLGFIITGPALAWGLFYYRMLDIAPVARSVVMEYMSDGVIVLDQQNRIVDYNPAARALFGHTLDKSIGQPVIEVLTNLPALAECCHQENVEHAELTLPIKDEPRILDLRVSLFRDRRGKPRGKLMIWCDITEKKQTEAIQRQYAAELKAQNAELDAFAHTVAHDLKKPLTELIGFSSLLKIQADKNLSESQGKKLDKIERSAFKMGSIIDELLLLASVRDTREIEIGELKMTEIIAESRLRLEYMIKEYQAEIIIPENCPPAIGYRPWIEEVWVNYISNAIKFGGKPPRLHVGTNSEQGMVRFWVRDNGDGLAADEQALLFTSFERLHQVSVEGHGLGLSIVRRIVEKLAGKVGVESEKGQGSTFYFTLPSA
jgi:PAS domain S-box-containing protein